MKKFLFFLFFILALGGTAFFFGWPHLTVPPGSYGVMQSKTHGLLPEVIVNGEFQWYWYRLIPTNAKVSSFTVIPVEYPIRSQGSLRSGDVYADLAGINADFSWEITGHLSFNIRPDALPEFTTRENILTNDDLRRAENRIAERISGTVIQWIRDRAESGDEERMISMLMPASIPELNNEISRNFPEIENLRCTVQVLRYPDFGLYAALRALYHEYLSLQNEILRPAVIRQAENRIETRLRLDELSRYGEILSRYPILLQFLALEMGIYPLPEPPLR